MDIAKDILLKYGWKEGDGLGKKANGITAPIKASLKFSTSGLGSNQFGDVSNNWWERVYNDATKNIEVQSARGPMSEEQVRLKQLESDAVEITTNSYSVKKLSQNIQTKSPYGNLFLKAGTLQGGIERKEAVVPRSEDYAFAPTRTLTDEELFAACGGRTAHKGARHGLKLSGKLARIDEQNNKLLKELESKSFEAVIKSNDWQIQKPHNGRKKSKKQKRNEQRWLEHSSVGAEDDEIKDMIHHTEYVVLKNKKSKKAQQQTDVDLATGVASMFAELPEDAGEEAEEPKENPKRRSKSASKKKACLNDELDQLSEKIRKLHHDSVTIKKKDKSKKKKLKPAKGGEDVEEEDGDSAMVDPAAKYRKDYRPDLKKNNQLLRKVVPHEFPEENAITKPTTRLLLDSSDEEEEDVVKRVNEEQDRYWRKMRATVPKINIIEPTEDDCHALGQSLKERHSNEVKRVGKRTSRGNRKKTKRKHRQVAQLADTLSKNL